MSQPLPPRGINAKDMQIIFQVLEKLPVWYAKGELTSPSDTTWTISANQMYACGLISKKEKKKAKRYSWNRQLTRSLALMRRFVHYGWEPGEQDAFKALVDDDFLNVKDDDEEERMLDEKD